MSRAPCPPADADASLWPRAILHVDMDSFYAAVEALDHPEWRGRPVIVGGASEARGVVSSASYEARRFGVRAAMPMAAARRLCPQGIFVPVRMGRYLEISRMIFAICARFTPDIQTVSCDEAFLDVTGCQRLFGSPVVMARQLKAAIKGETSLTASVGVAPNRLVAKIASDLGKPDGLVAIAADEVLERLAPLSVRCLWGVGEVTARRLAELGIETVAQLRAWPRETLRGHFGSYGEDLYNLARGIDHSPVKSEEIEKSLSAETTFAEDILDVAALTRTLLALADEVASRARRRGVMGRTVCLKVKYQDFTTITRRQTLPTPTNTAAVMARVAGELLRQRSEAGVRPVRLVGVGLGNLNAPAATPISLFQDESAAEERLARMEAAVDRIRAKLGEEAIQRATLLRIKPKFRS